MTAGMFGALQSTMEDGAWGVEHCLWVVCGTNGVVVVMPLLLLLATLALGKNQQAKIDQVSGWCAPTCMAQGADKWTRERAGE